MAFDSTVGPYDHTSNDVRISMMNSAPPAISQGVDKNGLLLGQWRRGLFSAPFASLIPNGAMSFLCPGISLAQISARLGLVDYYYVMFYFVLLYTLCIAAAATRNSVLITLCVVMSLIVAYSNIRLRWRIRQLFSIPGSLMEDLFASIFCGCFSISQMAAHVESFVPGECSIAPRAKLSGYN